MRALCLLSATSARFFVQNPLQSPQAPHAVDSPVFVPERGHLQAQDSFPALPVKRLTWSEAASMLSSNWPRTREGSALPLGWKVIAGFGFSVGFGAIAFAFHQIVLQPLAREKEGEAAFARSENAFGAVASRKFPRRHHAV